MTILQTSGRMKPDGEPDDEFPSYSKVMRDKLIILSLLLNALHHHLPFGVPFFEGVSLVLGEAKGLSPPSSY